MPTKTIKTAALKHTTGQSCLSAEDELMEFQLWHRKASKRYHAVQTHQHCGFESCYGKRLVRVSQWQQETRGIRNLKILLLVQLRLLFIPLAISGVCE